MRTPAAARVWVSVLLICAGIGLFPAYHRWFATRTWVAVDSPIPLAPGHVRIGDFHVNLHAVYYVGIEFQGYNSWQHPNCQDDQVIQARWWLWRDGRVAATWEDSWGNHWNGVPDGPVESPYLGVFDASPGHYDIDVEIASDASCLQPFHPRLRVYADDSDYAASGWINATAFLGSCALIGIGAGFLLVSSAAPAATAIQIPRGQSLAIFDTLRVQHESLRRRPTLMSPGAILPTVAYSYAATFFLLFLVIAPFRLSRFSRSQGIPVRLLRTDTIQATMDQPTTGLLVYVARNGDLYLNSRRLTSAQLERALEQQFALRADWSVYVESDPDVTYQTVVRAMDLVRSANGRVIMLRPGMRADAAAARSWR